MNAPTAPSAGGGLPTGTVQERYARSRPVMPPWTPPDYMTLALSRLRSTAPPVETVAFTALCPACGLECEWVEHREDTRCCVSVSCLCGEHGPSTAQRGDASDPVPTAEPGPGPLTEVERLTERRAC